MNLIELNDRLVFMLKADSIEHVLGLFDEIVLDAFPIAEYDRCIDWINDLYKANCAAGSFGDELIYDNKMYDLMRFPGALEKMDEVLEEYADNVGSEYHGLDLKRLTMLDMLRFVVDWRASEIGYLAMSMYSEENEDD